MLFTTSIFSRITFNSSCFNLGLEVKVKSKKSKILKHHSSLLSTHKRSMQNLLKSILQNCTGAGSVNTRGFTAGAGEKNK
jgi:hypothetical protein